MSQITYKVTEYLNFTHIPPLNKKTLTIGVGNNSGEKLGYIKWIPGFRKYGFQTIASVINYDAKCLKEITDELGYLNERHQRKGVDPEAYLRTGREYLKLPNPQL